MGPASQTCSIKDPQHSLAVLEPSLASGKAHLAVDQYSEIVRRVRYLREHEQLILKGDYFLTDKLSNQKTGENLVHKNYSKEDPIFN